MLTVACVEVGNYEGRGAEYVEKLRRMVARHLTAQHRFVVLTDDGERHGGPPGVVWLPPEFKGWWGKVCLFDQNLFEGRVLYLDLDTVIVGSLDELVHHKGILHLDHWGWERKVYGSGVMVWDAGEHAEIWTQFTPEVPRRFGGEGQGDQDWVTSLGGWDALPRGVCVSYRYHCRKNGPPAGASVVCFHGRPKPHEFTEGWVKEGWQ